MRDGKRLKVEIITVGNELISGHILDTNAAFLSDAVFSLGARVTRIVSISDDREIIAAALREAMTLGRGLTLHKEYLETLKQKFHRWNLRFTPSDVRVVFVPEGAEPLLNPIGICASD